MIFHTGPTKPALVLFCCIGTWLAICSSSFGAPTPEKIKLTLELLKLESEELYKNYSESKAASGMTADASLQLPCFSLGREAVTNISVMKAHLEKVKVLSKNTVDTTKATRWLDNISCSNPLNLNVSGPEVTDTSYVRKKFVLTVLERFSACMAELQAKDSIC